MSGAGADGAAPVAKYVDPDRAAAIRLPGATGQLARSELERQHAVAQRAGGLSIVVSDHRRAA